jgi:hypothetical protein
MNDTRLLLIAALSGAIACAATGAAHAAGEEAILKNTAAYHYTADDYRLLRSKVQEALAAPDGGAYPWRNGKTAASGSVTPLQRESWRGLECRRLRVETSDGVSTDRGVYRFCRTPSAGWKLAGPAAP